MIRLEGVTRRYRSAAGDRTALDAVDLHVARGAACGVVGRSEAGQSSLIRAIHRVQTPDAGRVFVAGRGNAAPTPAGMRGARRRGGMIFHHFNLPNAKTIEDHVAPPVRLEGRPEADV